MTAQFKASGKASNLYEADFYAWTQEQVALLQVGTWDCLDIANLIEEIASLGKQERQELRNHLGVLLGHLLKWEFQPSSRSKSWLATIREQRRRSLEILEDNPSLKPYLPDAIQKAYLDGIDLVVRETSLDDRDLPSTCPYTSEQILDRAFLPGDD